MGARIQPLIEMIRPLLVEFQPNRMLITLPFTFIQPFPDMGARILSLSEMIRPLLPGIQPFPLLFTLPFEIEDFIRLQFIYG